MQRRQAAKGGVGAAGALDAGGSQPAPASGEKWRTAVLLITVAAASAALTAAMLGSGLGRGRLRLSKDPTKAQLVFPGADRGCRPREEVIQWRAAAPCGAERWGDAGGAGGQVWQDTDETALRLSQMRAAPQLTLPLLQSVRQALSRSKVSGMATSHLARDERRDRLPLKLLHVLESNFLMVGTGVDSPMWALLNRCGRTVFVEASQQFADIVCGWVPHAEMLVYNDYRTTVASIPEDLKKIAASPKCNFKALSTSDVTHNECNFMIKLDKDLYDVEWDVLLVDGPLGAGGKDRGRLQIALTAQALALRTHRKTQRPVDWFLHDCDRRGERLMATQLWKESGYTVQHMKSPGRRDRQMCHVHVE